MKRPSFEEIDHKIISTMSEYGLIFLRYSVAIIFIWFGALKLIDASPATELVKNTVYWADPSWFVPFLGIWEMLIGLCFFYRPFIRVGIALLAPQMFGTFLPLILLPEITWLGFLMPTLEGQYIIKNLLIIGAAIVIGASVKKPEERLH